MLQNTCSFLIQVRNGNVWDHLTSGQLTIIVKDQERSLHPSRKNLKNLQKFPGFWELV